MQKLLVNYLVMFQMVSRLGGSRGDGLLDRIGGEQCDDGNAESGDGCSDICREELDFRQSPVSHIDDEYVKSLIVVKKRRCFSKQIVSKKLVFLRCLKVLEGLGSSGRLVARMSI